MCGIFGFIGRKPAATLLECAGALAATRGPHGWGEAFWDGERMQVLKNTHPLAAHQLLLYPSLIGHCRLATSGSRSVSDLQPIVQGARAVAHNGNVYNYRQIFQDYHYQPFTNNDSEAVLCLLEREGPEAVIQIVDHSSPLAVLALQKEKLLVIRRGHPLWILEQAEGIYFCSREMPGSYLMKDNSWGEYENLK